MVETDTGEIALDESFTATAVRAVIGSMVVSGGKRLFNPEKINLANVLDMIGIASRWQLDTLFATLVATLKKGAFVSQTSVSSVGKDGSLKINLSHGW